MMNITSIIKEAVLKIMNELEETGTLAYTSVEKTIQQTVCKAISEREEDDLYDYLTNKRLTGHKDICDSDAVKH